MLSASGGRVTISVFIVGLSYDLSCCVAKLASVLHRPLAPLSVSLRRLPFLGIGLDPFPWFFAPPFAIGRISHPLRVRLPCRFVKTVLAFTFE